MRPVASVTDELENQLPTLLLLLLSSEQLLHEYRLPVFDSAILPMLRVIQSCD